MSLHREPDLLSLLRDCYTAAGPDVVSDGLVVGTTCTLDAEAPGASIPGVAPRFIAAIRLRAPSADEAANALLLQQIENRLLGVEAISQVAIELLPPLFHIL